MPDTGRCFLYQSLVPTSWDIGLSKTGYISEAGCLVMEAKISEHPVIIVLLDSWGKNSRVGDANRVKKWMEKASLRGRNL
jgi:D-alanyl-D-alanine endopeptidase (penicillin-binding protein 7)